MIARAHASGGRSWRLEDRHCSRLGGSDLPRGQPLRSATQSPTPPYHWCPPASSCPCVPGSSVARPPSAAPRVARGHGCPSGCANGRHAPRVPSPGGAPSAESVPTPSAGHSARPPSWRSPRSRGPRRAACAGARRRRSCARSAQTKPARSSIATANSSATGGRCDGSPYRWRRFRAACSRPSSRRRTAASSRITAEPPEPPRDADLDMRRWTERELDRRTREELRAAEREIAREQREAERELDRAGVNADVRRAALLSRASSGRCSRRGSSPDSPDDTPRPSTTCSPP